MHDLTQETRAETLGARVAHALKRADPHTNVSAVRAALDDFLAALQPAPHVAPAKAHVAAYLAERIAALGQDRACTDFAWLQQGAAHIWGTAETAHFAVVLREARVSRKPQRAGEWERADRAAARLPTPWQSAMRDRVVWPNQSAGTVWWSASRVQAVADALARWHDWCAARGLDAMPTGTTLDAYATWLVSQEGGRVSTRSASDYLARIFDGIGSIVAPGFSSAACAYVVRDWRERADAEGTPTKTGAQLVTASALYDLGFDHMDRARRCRTRSTRAACEFRNGVLLAVAIALPKRARALSVLENGRTLTVLDASRLRVRIPARHLKLPEAEKSGPAFEAVFTNSGLASAVLEYLRDFRPIFDGGALLFPSCSAPGQGLSENRLGQIVGDLTEARFGVRIPIHRLRDNVATECAESLPGGARLAAPLLGHTSVATTDRHYVRAEGLKAAEAFGACLEARRSAPEDLLV